MILNGALVRFPVAVPVSGGHVTIALITLIRDSIMRAHGEMGSCHVGLFTVSLEGAGWANIELENLTMTERSRGGKLLDVLGRIVWNNSWGVVFYKHGRCKLRYVVYTGCCIGFSGLSPVGDNIQLSNLLYIFTAQSCYCYLFFFVSFHLCRLLCLLPNVVIGLTRHVHRVYR